MRENMKKICYVVTLPMTIEAFFIPQLQYLAQNGFDVSVICSNSDVLQEKLGDNISFVPIEIPRGVSVGGMFKATQLLIKHFKTEKYDIVQYSTPNAGFCAALASKISGVRARNYHLMGYRYLGSKGIKKEVLKLFEKVACALSSTIECVSQSNLEFGVTEKIFKEGKATVVWNGSTGGVDLNKYNYDKRFEWRKTIRKSMGYAEDDFVYGFVGRITRDKGINELLQAFLQLNDNSKLLIVGDMEGEETLDAELLKKARSNSNIIFHDSVKNIECYYAAIDVLVLPSHREGFGNVVIEAGAVGTPAIVSDIAGPTDAIRKGVTAYAVPSKNADKLTEEMKKIKDADYINMGNAAAEYAKNAFDSKVMCEKILERKWYLFDNYCLNKKIDKSKAEKPLQEGVIK
jgi:glycosyltransferase involved in cell wall biosynthesis